MIGRSLSALLLFTVMSCDTAEQPQRMVGQLASERIEMSAEFTDPVIGEVVIEGTHVAAGDLLIEQDTTRIEARMRAAEAARDEVAARLAELTRGPRREQIDAARARVSGGRRELEFRRLEFARARDVHAQRLASAETVDRAQAAFDAAEADLAVGEARLEELLTGTTLEELQQVEQRLSQAEAQLAVVAADRDRYHTRAPLAAIVDSVLIEIGERPQPGQAMLILLPGSQPHARVYVPEALRVRVAPGAAVRVHVDGLDTVIAGHVRWVASDPEFTPYFALTEHDRGRLSYVAKIDLDYDGERLPDGVPVEVVLDKT